MGEAVEECDVRGDVTGDWLVEYPACGENQSDDRSWTERSREKRREKELNKRARAGKAAARKARKREAELKVCRTCSEYIPGYVNLCPNCGLNPGVQTITELEPLYQRRKRDKEAK